MLVSRAQSIGHAQGSTCPYKYTTECSYNSKIRKTLLPQNTPFIYLTSLLIFCFFTYPFPSFSIHLQTSLILHPMVVVHPLTRSFSDRTILHFFLPQPSTTNYQLPCQQHPKSHSSLLVSSQRARFSTSHTNRKSTGITRDRALSRMLRDSWKGTYPRNKQPMIWNTWNRWR